MQRAVIYKWKLEMVDFTGAIFTSEPILLVRGTFLSQNQVNSVLQQRIASLAKQRVSPHTQPHNHFDTSAQISTMALSIGFGGKGVVPPQPTSWWPNTFCQVPWYEPVLDFPPSQLLNGSFPGGSALKAHNLGVWNPTFTKLGGVCRGESKEASAVLVPTGG